MHKTTISGKARIGILAALAAAATAVLAVGMSPSRPALASHSGGMDLMAIDMQESGNTATGIGTRQDCVRIDENNVQDADEDAVDAVFIDITATQVPAATPIEAYQSRLNYDDLNLSVMDFDSSISLVGSVGAGQPAAFYAATPDGIADSAFYSGVVDADSAPSGNGVLIRLTLATLNSAATGDYPLTLSEAAHVDPAGGIYVPDALLGATLAVNQACAGGSTADLVVTSVTASAPSLVNTNAAFSVSVNVSVRNTGPTGPVNADTQVGLALPPDCSTGTNPVTVQNSSLATGVTTNLPTQTFSVSCTNAGFHSFVGDALAILDQAGVTDPNSGNNSLPSSPVVTSVFADADGDGIEDGIDTLPFTYSFDAFDELGAVDTTGHLDTANGAIVYGTDEDDGAADPNLRGFRVTVTGSSGGPAAGSVCGYTGTQPRPSSVVYTCGSLTVAVQSGSAIIGVDTMNAAIPDDTTVTFKETSPDVFEVTNQAGSAGSVVVGNVTVTPGNIASVTDLDGDGQANQADADDDGDLVSDIAESSPCDGDPLNKTIRPERIDGIFDNVDDDGDTEVDEALPPGSDTYDCDGDGYTGNAESSIFSGPPQQTQRDQDPCGADGWPLELSSIGFPINSANRINAPDIQTFLSPRRYDTSPGDGNYNVRWDIVPGPNLPIFPKHINLVDLQSLVFNLPPMFGGATRAMNGPVCPWAP